MCEQAKWVGCSLRGVLARAENGDEFFWEQSRFFLFEGVGGKRDFLFFPLFPMCSHHVPKGNPVWSGDIVLGLGLGIVSLEEYGKEGMCHVLLPMQYLKFFTRNQCLGWLDGWSSGCDNAGVGFVMGSGEVVDWVGLCWTTVRTILAAASADAFNQVPLCSTFVSTFVFTYFSDVS